MENTTHKTQTKSAHVPFQRFFTWRIARRMLVGLSAFATLIAIFYTVENWRGKRAWENCKRELEAKGAVFDWNAFIPPVVPADQNFFDAPNMAVWFIRSGSTTAQNLGQTNTNEFRARLGSNTNRIIEITTETAARDYLAWSEKLGSDFDAIREALKRPYSRMGGDYSQPFAIPIPDFITVRMVAQTLSHRAKSHLLLGNPEKALSELTLVHNIRRLLESEPSGQPMTFVAAMINVAVTGHFTSTVADGLQLQAWREPQLVALGKQLEAINLLPPVFEAFKFEQVASAQTLETIPLRKIFSFEPLPTNPWEKMKYLKYSLVPRGWIYQNMVIIAKLKQKPMEGLDLMNRLVSPHIQNEAPRELEMTVRRFSPYTFIAHLMTPNFSRAIHTLALNQTKANQAFLACALEQYRLAHGNFPKTLDALVPRFANKLPHDIIGGQPLKYRRTDDGKFILYSVGWNESDDGGTIVPRKTTGVDSEKGDWVWQGSSVN